MFFATLAFCSMIGGNCFNFDDTWGPYLNIEQCEERIVEMKKFISENTDVQLYILQTLKTPPEFIVIIPSCEKEGKTGEAL